MRRAMERQAAGEATVIPVILRPCDWHGAPFGKFQAVPKDGKPVTLMPDIDQALLEVARAIRSAAEAISGRSASPRPLVSQPLGDAHARSDRAIPRSSNLRIAKQFTDRDRDAFRLEAFEYIARFFESSLAELQARNAGIETAFRRVYANRFTASEYRNGIAEARCTIFIGGGAFRTVGIAYVNGETDDSNAFNEQLTVHSDDQAVFLRPMGMAFDGGERDTNFSFEVRRSFSGRCLSRHFSRTELDRSGERMTRVVQPPGARGSLKWIQRAVDERWPSLEQPISAALGGASIEWRSPLRGDDFAEYRDGDFLDAVGLTRLRPQLAKFWPARGPQWDALAVAATGEIILVEAKAHVGEMCSAPTQASQASREMIESSLQCCAASLHARTRHADWSEHFYQLANRLAHLQFLLDHGGPAVLVLVNFLNDVEMNGPTTAEAWEAAYQVAFHVLGLARRHPLSGSVLHVYPDITAGRIDELPRPAGARFT